ncbi:hypothetical protein SAMN05421823_109196 [Catalinimonas alkaloidigena]|uniref:Calcineurin-like phosphoesterase domain-containing protein n=1 Tax=Catalinimonas alkaloidigena TaxID=1075417 RepID=A0A1G9PHI7_9BACT|nr:metallophosphoesterase [Catalinimonas alkaloidigena]SDL98199.1 hypothetical protein SAMN05421823_109196 [Catalinimonas alkaloidigena]
MTSRIVGTALATVLFLLIDFYVFQAVRVAFQAASPLIYHGVAWSFWGLTALTLLLFWLYRLTLPDRYPRLFQQFMLTGLFVNYFSKVFVLLFLFIGDLARLGKWVVQQVRSGAAPADDIPRSELVSQVALAAGAVPFVAMSYGILSGAHDYRIRHQRVVLPHLPRALDGLRAVQISDVHSGSFFNKTAVRGGIDLLLREKPDVVFFTGDLVNNQAREMKEYKAIFEKVKAPLGVYSTFGNHDYGDYVRWPSEAAKRQNLEDLARVHREMGWDLLIDEHRLLRVDGESLAVIGIQNYSGNDRFPKYGNLPKAHHGTEDQPVKILLSHDPSHWRAQVIPQFSDIDLMLAGHTHGMQFGVEIGSIQWSPVKYVYKEWAGMYQEGAQRLYVNRGYGYLGFPGRIGMPPEITVLELVRA